MTQATKFSMEIESSSFASVLAVATLDITQPETDGINRRGKYTDEDASDDKNEPDVACIKYSPSITCQPRSICVENAKSLTFFGVLEYPVNGRQVFVSHSSSRSLRVPIQGSPFLRLGPIIAGRCSDVTKAGVRSISRVLFAQLSGSAIQIPRRGRDLSAVIGAGRRVGKQIRETKSWLMLRLALEGDTESGSAADHKRHILSATNGGMRSFSTTPCEFTPSIPPCRV